MNNLLKKSAANLKRWQEAQEYERRFWKRLGKGIERNDIAQLDWYQWKANLLEGHISGLIDKGIMKTAKILEIGSGPIGIITFLKWGERYTIDPLEDFYRSNPALSLLRNPAVRYGQGTGEDLPFENDFFSLVILDNVLDHVQEAGAVLDEIHRVMSKDGLLYLAVNVHSRWGAVMHTLLSKLKIDRGHPYTFTISRVRILLEDHKFNIRSELVEDYFQVRDANRSSSVFKDKIKGYTGLSEFVYRAIYTKAG